MNKRCLNKVHEMRNELHCFACDIQTQQNQIDFANLLVKVSPRTFNDLILNCHEYGNFIIENMTQIGKAFYDYAIEVDPYLVTDPPAFTYIINQRRQTNKLCSEYIASGTHSNNPEALWKDTNCFNFGQWISLMIFNDEYLKNLPTTFYEFVTRITNTLGTQKTYDEIQVLIPSMVLPNTSNNRILQEAQEDNGSKGTVDVQGD